MPRKKEIAAPVQIGPDYVTETPQDMQEDEANWRQGQLEQARNLEIVDGTYGDNLPYDRTRLENEAQFYLRESAGAMLEAGKRLIVIKEHEGHGEFGESLQRIGLAPRTAQVMMRASVKFGGAKTQALAHLGKAKMFELMVEDDEDLEALADGGTVAGLKLDDVEKMTVRELKAALRKERDTRKAEAEAAEQLLSKKDDKINELDKAFIERTRRVKTWDGVVIELSANITRFSGGAIQELSHLSSQIDEILREADERNLSDEEVTTVVEPMYHAINSLQGYLSGLRARFDNEISGYMPVHDVPYQPLPDFDQTNGHSAE